MRKKNVIDYEKNKQVSQEMEKILRSKMQEILGSDISDDYYEFIKLITSVTHD